MAYIGPLPAETFTSFATQEFSTSATTSYTLDHPVTNENELALFINNVRQQPGSGKAYTARGTALTLSAATASTDTMYAVFLGRALQTVNPADASVGTAQLAADAVTEAKIADDAVESEHLNNNIISGQTALGATPADTDELLVSDAGTLKRVDFSYLKGGGMFEFISSTDVTSDVAQVDFTSFSTDYTDFKLIVQNLHLENDNQNPELRYFNSAGNIMTGSYYDSSYQAYVDGGENQTTISTQDRLRLGPPIGNASHEAANLEVTVFDVHDTGQATATEGWKAAMAHMVYSNNGGNVGISQGGGWSKENNGGNYSITGIRFFMSGGDIKSGRFSLYGRKHS